MSDLETRQVSDLRGGFYEEHGRWSEVMDYDQQGNKLGMKRVWTKYIPPLPELQSLGSEYETTGPSGAPKVLAFVHKNTGQISLSFYILKKSSVRATNGSSQDQREAVTNPQHEATKNVTRWEYVDLFMDVFFSGSDDDTHNQTITNRFDHSHGVNATEGTSTRFDVAQFFMVNKFDVKSGLGPAFGIIAFDKGGEITFEESKKYDESNRRGRYMVIPVKLSNPRCIYVEKEQARTIPKYLTYQEETALITQKKQQENEFLKKRSENDQTNKNLEGEIEKIEKKREEKIGEINKETLFKGKKIEKYKSSAEYLNDESIINEYKEKMAENKKKLTEMLTEIQRINQKLNRPPTIYRGNSSKPTPTFFIDPDFSPSSLVRLVSDSAAATSRGGRTHKSRKSKKSMKIKKRYIRSRKHSKKYRRHSYRK